MRLRHLAEKTQPWAVFEETPGKFTDFKEVRKTIEQLTDKVAGSNALIVDKPIVLTIYSHTCPDLTLIDLPGITRISLAGTEQEGHDMEKITKEMCLRYVDDPRTIILCVIPANADITTSDALQMARKIDSKGIRTVGVITKIDIMDAGTNAKKMITGQEVPLRLGYVGVKNRSQADIMDDKGVKKALKEEEDFFAQHPVYQTMPQNCLGTKTLTTKCTKIMFTHIKTHLPDIMREIKDKIVEIEQRLINLGPPMPSETRDKQHLLWNMVTEFINEFKGMLSGKTDQKVQTQIKEMKGGAKIKEIFDKIYVEYVSNYKATKDYNDADIERAIALHEGDQLPGFPSVDVFHYLMRPQLELLEEPAQDCLSDVHQYIEQMADEICDKVFMRFPSARNAIMEIVSKTLYDQMERTKKVTDCVIRSEIGYQFTNDAKYLQTRTEIVPEQQQQVAGQ